MIRVGAIRRRDFLSRTGRATLALGATSQLGWLTACHNSGPAEPADPGLRLLASALRGRIVGPGDAEYPRASRLFNPRFDAIRPRVIAFCESPEDVRLTLAWARENELPIAARNGRHSYGGYSSSRGVVADLSRLNEVEHDPLVGTVRVGAGARMIDVYAELARDSVTVPGGSCPSVGISGLALGGGIGLSARKLGLTSDSLRAVELITASGDSEVASAEENPALFWACRGGGGGNFGVVTAFHFDVHSVGDVAIYDFRWDWEHARAVADAWQRFAPKAPDELFSILKLANAATDPKREPAPFVTSYGQFFGPASELRDLLEPLLAAGGPATQRVAEMSYLDAQAYWAGCEDGPERCAANVERVSYKAKSQYVSKQLPDAGIETMIDWVERWPGSSSAGGGAVQLDPAGGAINAFSPRATAFVHRDQLFHCQYLAHWGRDDPPQVVDAARTWIADFDASMRRFSSGSAYQNYIDPDLAGWERAYYGENLPRLMKIRSKYDPDGVFDFPQSIPRLVQ